MHTYMYDKSLTLRYISLISRCKQASGKLDHLHSLHTSDPTGEKKLLPRLPHCPHELSLSISMEQIGHVFLHCLAVAEAKILQHILPVYHFSNFLVRQRCNFWRNL